MVISIHVEEAEDTQDTLISLRRPSSLYKHGRQRSMSLMDAHQMTFSDGKYLSDRSVFTRRLHLSIPPSRPPPDTALCEDTGTPQSESPQTPASITSPIAGVVDLTKDVTTTSTYSVAQGGLSDIYLGEWHHFNDITGSKEVVQVCRSLLNFKRLLITPTGCHKTVARNDGTG